MGTCGGCVVLLVTVGVVDDGGGEGRGGQEGGGAGIEVGPDGVEFGGAEAHQHTPTRTLHLQHTQTHRHTFRMST